MCVRRWWSHFKKAVLKRGFAVKGIVPLNLSWTRVKMKEQKAIFSSDRPLNTCGQGVLKLHYVINLTSDYIALNINSSNRILLKQMHSI